MANRERYECVLEEVYEWQAAALTVPMTEARP